MLFHRFRLLAPLALLAACARSDGARAEPLLVLAASDLLFALPEVAAAYQARTGQPVELVFGSTGNLAAQIENGAPADLFLSANEAFVDRLERGGHAREGTRRMYALGRVALVWRPGGAAPADPAALAEGAFRTVAIANPEHAPYGAAAREVLLGAGVWDAVRPRLVLGENVAQTMQFVRTGNADAGLVALSVAIRQDRVPFRAVERSLHTPLRQAGVVLADSPRPEAAADFLAELTGAGGREVLGRYGFDPPDHP